MCKYEFSNANFAHLLQQRPGTKKTLNVNAKAEFHSRKMEDKRLKKCVLAIVDRPHERFKLLEAISTEFLDAADVVRRLRRDHGLIKRDFGLDYYCRQIENHISRSIGLQILRTVNHGSQVLNSGIAPICGLFALNCFRGNDGLDFDLNEYIDSLEQTLTRDCPSERWRSLLLVQSNGEMLGTKVEVLMAALLRNHVRPVSATDYQDLRNSFLSYTAISLRPTIPITMVAIFCALCARMNLYCVPVGFPGQVLALMKDEDGKEIYVAPYELGKIYTRAELVAKLQSFGWHGMEELLSPMSAEQYYFRSAHNILNSIEEDAGSDVHTLEGFYAALSTLRTLGHDMPLSEDAFIRLVCLYFPFDICIYEELGNPEHKKMIADTRSAAAMLPIPKRRTDQPEYIRHRIGTLFRHRLFNYSAL